MITLQRPTVTFSSADLHIHTSCSDGAASPRQMAETLAKSGLAVAAITDHDTVAGALRVREELCGDGPEIVAGAEISTADGHLLALYVEEDVPPDLSAAETVGLIHEQGGLAIAAHPYFPFFGLGDLAARLDFDAVEVANGTPLGEVANRQARRRLGPRAAAVVGGSDAHQVAAVGHVRTVFPGRTAADLREAIEAGQARPAFEWGRHLVIAPALLARIAWVTLRDAIAAPQTERRGSAEGRGLSSR